MTAPEHRFLFEVSWEVCNKVGGIYTVLASKARHAVGEFGDRYCLLGPDLKTNREFEETEEEAWGPLREAVALKELPCRFGRWVIPGRPRVILVDFTRKYHKDQLLFQLWEQFGVDSISGGWDYVEPVMFSYACGEVIESAFNLWARPARAAAVAQFHEWMCGAGLLCLKKRVPEIGTIFTTHATILGRSMAGDGVDIYSGMENIAPQKEAAARHIAAKHSMECASAREADCFTTVSSITASEATAFLGRKPDILLPNGLDMDSIPDLVADRAPASQARARLLELAARFLRKPFPPETRLLLISGRYEFHNKGIDVFLEALGRLEKERRFDRPVLAFLFVMAGHREINPAALGGAEERPAGLPPIATHRLMHEASDPILEACNRLGLKNNPENAVHVIFLPAFLDGHDGLLNMTYYEALSACDLGVFPSYYEPWGYTPLESAAYAVPTITSDQAGFGVWVRESSQEDHGVVILNRRRKDMASIVNDLAATLLEAVNVPEGEQGARRRAARAIALRAGWNDFFAHYRRAFEHALNAAAARMALLGSAAYREEMRFTYAGTASLQPHFRSLTAMVSLPHRIERLRELAHNLWWTWHPEALDLFALLDPRRWAAMRNNPVRMLEAVDPARLEELAASDGYLQLYDRVLRQFDDYMKERVSRGRASPIRTTAPVAYFCTEYGLHESLPIYSGGLGVLAGDHLKTASDLHLPMIGVGLLYKNGYLRQRIAKNGWQVAEYPENDFCNMPIHALQDDQGRDVQVTVELPGRLLYAAVWEVKVGRVPLYLLSTDVPANTVQDRAITARLYCADRRIRVEQEILLGMGGVRLLRRLGITPSVYHINEGHSAFLLLERIQNLMTEEGLSFDEAREAVRANTVFTTHTPVDAGNEQFDKDLIEYYFSAWVQRTGISWDAFWELGRKEPGPDKPFYMTLLALKLSHGRNAVSRVHGTVAREMWKSVWPGFHVSDVPIATVTNGVHTPSIVGRGIRQVLDQYLGLGWENNLAETRRWKRIHEVPDELLWKAKCEAKQDLIAALRQDVSENHTKYGNGSVKREQILTGINPGALLIGFARRFAPYKRADLILSDPDRLSRILNHPQRPVYVVFAGKAHPNDGLGNEIVKKMIDALKDPRFLGKIFFLEDYDLGLARLLLQGADVWLNTPLRPLEASGTSGQKATVNATLNLSVSDGWWCEGFDGTNGWTIGPALTEYVPPLPDASEEDAKSLYALLEERVVPAFYERGGDGLPRQWLAMIKHAFETIPPYFNSHRMLQEYAEHLYLPAAERGAVVFKDRFKLARELADWKRKVPTRFSSLRLLDVSLKGVHGDNVEVGRPFRVTVRMDPGAMSPDEIMVEMLLGRRDGTDIREPAVCVPLRLESSAGNVLTFSAEHAIPASGQHAYGIRVFPCREGLASKHDGELVVWG